jgi:acyl-CoA synthetase (AMP-forming)/AMP-acid ligase II
MRFRADSIHTQALSPRHRRAIAQLTLRPPLLPIMSPIIHDLNISLSSSTVPETLLDVLFRTVYPHPSHELGFITSSAHESAIQTKTFSEFNQSALSLAKAIRAWGKPAGSVVVVYLTEHEDNMTAVWACLLAGYVPCLQPALSAQQAHKEGHVTHIKNLFSSATWLTNESGADQVQSISGLDIHLLSELNASAENLGTDFVVHQPKPDDEAILFLTSGSTGFSKAVVHTHRTVIAACYTKGQSYGLASQSKIMNCEFRGCLSDGVLTQNQGSDSTTSPDHSKCTSHHSYLVLRSCTSTRPPSSLIPCDTFA